ncbi:NADH dehydrogenase I, D subunit [Thermosinus carboxydivorans Nor1]|uniref:NADH-quinone oxidoreductase subunit D n=1 Tax=Thermosinus carboxydivorans Nor1 TaxID=401526 RepID=A1HPT4_9FIRM|nr:NADH-quinone oxidoreductase subunit D [Thermosinus carboxydivorans]EAX48053.1 NADH dehydrogenase I, D subunit [Thermosinus carboxydivorans Nor1]
MTRTEVYTLNMGPQHPSTHGVLRVVLELDGETVVRATPEFGYLHRGIEKLAEKLTYQQITPYTDRLDYLSAMGNNLGYCQAVEKLMGLTVPERAEYLRIIMVELNRIASHLLFLGSIAIDLGGSTGLMYAFRDRERILDLFDLACGARLTYNYIRIGGVMADVPPEFPDAVRRFLDDFPAMLEEYHGLITGNEIFYYRLKDTAIISGERALALGLTGPVLRASGVDYDLRKAEPYGIYDRFDFRVPLGSKGDNWDRYLVRMEEMAESARIVRQALDQLPAGPVMAQVPKVIKPPAGEVYHRIENPRGELGYYIVSDGSTKPYRFHVRRPSFINLAVVDELCRGGKVADVVAVLATLDPVMGEVDC